MSERSPLFDPGTLALLDAVPERLLVCLASGPIVYVHPLTETLLGTTGEALRGRSIHECLLTADGLPFTLETLTQVVTRGADTPTGVILKHTTEGVQLHMLLVAKTQVLEGRTLWFLSLRDRAPDSPSTREDVYQPVFERAPVGIFHISAAGVITACNDAFAAIIGSPKRVLVGLSIGTLPNQRIVECLHLSLAGEVAHYEGAYRSATGQKTTQVRVVFAPIFDTHDKVTGAVGIVADITAQMETEQALKRSLAALHSVMEHAPDAITIHRDGKLVEVNPRAAEMFGYESPEPLIGRPITDFIHPEEHETLKERIQGLVHGVGLRPHEYRMRRCDGSFVRVEVKSIAFEYGGEPSVLVFGRDITERRELEARLQQADRMASVGTLAAGVAHEINNPLGYVMMTAELLSRRLKKVPGSDKAIVDSFERILEGCDRIRTIVRDLSTFSRRSDEILTSVEVNQAVTTSVNMVRHTVRHKAQLVVELAHDLPRVRGDQARLSQVFVNLLVNAAQAINDGNADGHTVRISTESIEGRVRVRVRDDGEGMAPHVQQRIFEPFFTTKAPGVGSGLGLAICHGIVRSHGGTIRVRTEVGAGSEFIVDLPAESTAPLRTVYEVPVEGTALAPRARILVIDDEISFADALRETLSERHTVTVARNGREGIEAVLQQDPPDLILCDVMMPDITGLGVFELVTEQKPALAQHFVFMTGGAVTERAREMLAFTDRPVLDKPFDAMDVERILLALHEARA